MISIVSWGSEAQAQPSERFPESVTVSVEGERHQAFNLGGFTELLEIDAELTASTRLVENLTEQTSRYRLVVHQLRLTNDSLVEVAEILQQERERLIEKWKEENKARLEAENVPSIGSWLGFALAGAFGVATLVLGLILGLAG